MRVEREAVRLLRFDDGAPVLGASALARLGRGWLVAQRDAGDAAWAFGGGVTRVPLAPGLGLEAACTVPADDGAAAALLLGGGTTPGSRRGAVVSLQDGSPSARVGELAPLYEAVARALEVAPEQLDLQGVARNGPVLRWFHSGPRSASVDVGLPALLEALAGRRDPADVPLRAVRRYQDLPGPATDAVALPGGRVVLSTVAEASVSLVLLDDDGVLAVAELPAGTGRVQGLGVVEVTDDGALLLALVEAADPQEPCGELALRVRWGS